MKKLAILAIIGFAVSVQAVSITWAVGSTLYGVNGGTATQAYTATSRTAGYWSDDFQTGDPAFVLVYLGVNAAATTADKVTSDMIKQTVAASDMIRHSGTQSTQGRANLTSSYSADNVVGATYQVFFSYNGELRDIYTDASLSTAAAVTASVVQDPTTEVFSSNPTTLYGAGSGSTVGYVSTAPIPEPGTAAMALLGLGLLIRRRKA